MLALTVALSLFVLGSSVDLTCPKSPIDVATPSGEFPIGGVAQFPTGYNCSIDFRVPTGWVVKLKMDSVFQDNDQHLQIRDSISTTHYLSYGNSTFYCPADKCQLSITTNSSQSSFYFNWEFQKLSDFSPIKAIIGKPLKLNFDSKSYYHFISKDNVVFHTSKLDQRVLRWEQDPDIAYIYVYDGADLNSTFLGDLFTLSMRNQTLKSSGNSLSLVNIYGYNTKSYGLANDFSAISGYEFYNFTLITRNLGLWNTNMMEVSPDGVGAITFFTPDSEEMIVELSLDSDRFDGQSMKLQPLTPSHGIESLVTYAENGTMWNYFPQLIPSNLFTWVVTKSSGSYMITVEDVGAMNSTDAFDTKKGYIFSPSLWKTQNSSAYSVTIGSPSMYSFSYTINSFISAQSGETLTVEASKSSSNITSFHANVTNSPIQVINGTSFTTSFTGISDSSSFILAFEMTEIKPSGSSTVASYSLVFFIAFALFL